MSSAARGVAMRARKEKLPRRARAETERVAVARAKRAARRKKHDTRGGRDLTLPNRPEGSHSTNLVSSSSSLAPLDPPSLPSLLCSVCAATLGSALSSAPSAGAMIHGKCVLVSQQIFPRRGERFGCRCQRYRTVVLRAASAADMLTNAPFLGLTSSFTSLAFQPNLRGSRRSSRDAGRGRSRRGGCSV